ncbi:MAG: hypothetical protein ACI9T7_002678, partial [Oleiphilaceae bacterium]
LVLSKTPCLGSFAMYNTELCPSGEIGRRGGFKIPLKTKL